LKHVKNGKNDAGDRESSFGRLLARTLRTRSASVTDDVRSASLIHDGCLDADTLAAWADDRLGRAERTAAEAHAADCARCQALLAAMVKTAPAAAAARPPWRIPAFGWLISVTAAAAAIVLWVIVPGHITRQENGRDASSIDQRAAADASAPSPPPVTLERKVPAEGRAGPSNESQNGQTRSAPASAVPIPRRAQVRAAAAPAAPVVTTAEDARHGDNDKKASSPAEANRRSEALLEARVGDAAASPKVEPQSAAAAVPQPAMAKSFTRALVEAGGTVIVSPNPARRWRIVPGGPGGAVQRSTDGGSTWHTQETGASVTLAAGASPTPSVCWLVGPAGAVLRSTDGRSWQRLAFPEAANLVSVTATDGKTATVTAADGRTFSTTDGGLTWLR
jgi:hypothetical protein